jgi:stage II sporulation protein D
MKRALLLLLLVSVASAQAPSVEVQKTYKESLDYFREGDFAKAASGYEYLVTLGPTRPRPISNLALMYRDMGEPEVAAAHWLKATLLTPEDTFAWNHRGWNYLALGRFREARDSFRKAVEVSSASIYGAEAYFGLGMTESIDGNSKQAVEALNKAKAAGNPYLRPAVETELARLAKRMRRYPKAIPFYTASLSADEMQSDVLRELAWVYDKTGQSRAAWQALKLSLDIYPDDPESITKKKKLEKYIKGRPADSMPLLRLSRPLQRRYSRESVKDRASPKLRVAMFSGPDGQPRHLTRFYIMGSTSTRLYDLKLTETIDIAANYTQWEVLYRADNRVIEIRDTTGRIVYVTKQPFRLEPIIAGWSLLLKNPDVTNIDGIDLSDRELRGDLEIIPTPFGFHVINEIPVEEYLFSVIGRNLPLTPAIETYKMLAVMLRTVVQERMRTTRPSPENTQFTDSDIDLPYYGLTKERSLATKAVRATRGITLKVPRGQRLEFHKSSGWATRRGIQDRMVPKLPYRDALDFEQLLHGYPDKNDFSEQAAVVPPVWSRVTRVFDAKTLRKNMNKIEDVGPIRHVRVGQRDETGRVLSLFVEGARGKRELIGPSQMARFLSPGSLRSTLFTLQPIYKGRKLRRLILWGAGTGHGRGVSLAGALGQAHLGRRFDEIITHYYPEIGFNGYTPPKKPSVLRKRGKHRAKPRRRRRKSYRSANDKKRRRRRIK